MSDHTVDNAATPHARLETAAQLADALGEKLSGHDRRFAYVISRLCCGEITPEQALAETED